MDTTLAHDSGVATYLDGVLLATQLLVNCITESTYFYNAYGIMVFAFV